MSEDLSALPFPAPEHPRDEDWLRRLAEHGWMVQGVSPTPADPSWTPRFSYTVGLERTFGHPELIVLGIDTRPAYDVLARVVERIRAGEAFAPGDRATGVVEDVEVVFGDVQEDHRRANLTFADWVYHRRPFRALQVLWSDDGERLSGDPGDLMEAADAGDAGAAVRFAHLMWRYDYFATAEDYYRLAAEAGHAEALLGLGLTLERRDDPDGAITALREAAAAGVGEAEEHIARLTSG